MNNYTIRIFMSACILLLFCLHMVGAQLNEPSISLPLEYLPYEDSDTCFCDTNYYQTSQYACVHLTQPMGGRYPDEGSNSWILTQIKVRVYGSFSCDLATEFNFTINSYSFTGVMVESNTAPNCTTCRNCWASTNPVEMTSEAYHTGLPGYITGGTNDWSLTPMSPYTEGNKEFCVSQVFLDFTYSETADLSDSSSSDEIVGMKIWFFSLCLVVGIIIISLATLFFVLWRRSTSKNKKMQKGYRRMEDATEFIDTSQLSEITIDIKTISLESEIGRGSFGLVYRGRWSGTEVAVKRLPPQSVSEKETLSEFMKEAFIMQKLRHPNVLQVLGVCLSPACIVMEFMPRGSLFSLVHDPDVALDWTVIRKVALDVCKGMAYLHSRSPPLVHRDLKPHNLLVDDNWRVKVCDFGLSRFVELQKNMTACGTPAYAAPEVLRNSQYSTSADVFSFGIVLWEIISRQTPYPSMPPFQIIYQVGTQKVRPPMPASCPPEMASLIRECWTENADERPTFIQLTEMISMMDFSSPSFLSFTPVKSKT